MHGCFYPNLDAEADLQDALEFVAQEISELNLVSEIRAVVLGGGYGRGEGGITPEGTLYNDLDFFVISEASPERRAEIDRALEPIAEHCAQMLHIDVDFAPARSIRSFVRDADTLMIRELVHGNSIIFGDVKVFEPVPQYPIETVPWREGARLMLNRGAGLLMAIDKLAAGTPAPEDIDFVRRNLAKCALGCGDALLIASGQYHQKGIERKGILLKDTKLPPRFLKAYAAALEYKYHPAPDGFDATPETAALMKRFWFGTLEEFTQRVTRHAHSGNPVGNAMRLARCARGRRGFFRNIAVNFIYRRELGNLVLPFSEHPRVKLLALLADLLANPDQEQKKAKFFALWNRFN